MAKGMEEKVWWCRRVEKFCFFLFSLLFVGRIALSAGIKQALIIMGLQARRLMWVAISFAVGTIQTIVAGFSCMED